MANLISRNPRMVVLIGVLIGLVLTIVLRERPFEPQTQPELRTNVTYDGHEIPALRSPRSISVSHEIIASLRDPFSYPAPQRAVDLSSSTGQTTSLAATNQPTKRAGPLSSHRIISFEYLGYIGPNRRPFAVFRNEGEIELVRTGQVLDGRFVLRKFNHLGAVFTTVGGEPPKRVRIPVADR